MKYLLLLLGLLLPLYSQTVETVHRNPGTGTTTNCGGSPNIQYNDNNGTIWVCRPGSGWSQFTSGASPAGVNGSVQIKNGSALGSDAGFIDYTAGIADPVAAPVVTTSGTPGMTTYSNVRAIP